MVYFVYILSCADTSLYTGVTNNLERRLKAHNAGRGARYTRARLPVQIVYCEPAVDRSSAQKREAAIKRLSRAEKIALIQGGAASPEALET